MKDEEPLILTLRRMAAQGATIEDLMLTVERCRPSSNRSIFSVMIHFQEAFLLKVQDIFKFRDCLRNNGTDWDYAQATTIFKPLIDASKPEWNNLK